MTRSATQFLKMFCYKAVDCSTTSKSLLVYIGRLNCMRCDMTRAMLTDRPGKMTEQLVNAFNPR